jgi:hypothetical protein
MHEGAELDGLQSGTGTVEAAFSKVFLENFARLGIFFEDLADIHLFVDPPSFLPHGPSYFLRSFLASRWPYPNHFNRSKKMI